MSNVVCITVSTNYDDILDIIIPQNSKLLKKWYIVTDHNDRATINVINKHNCSNIEILFFDLYNNSTFNQGGAIKLAQNKAFSEFDTNTIILIMDSDIYLPDDFIQITSNIEISRNMIFGAEKRLEFHSHDHFLNNIVDNITLWTQAYIAGFFQLCLNDPNHVYSDSSNASSVDMRYRDTFEHKRILNVSIKHLGKTGVNWDGRKNRTDYIM